MKAIVYHEYGSPGVLKCEEVEKPVPRDNEVLIKVPAASVNPLDWGLMKGSGSEGGTRSLSLQVLTSWLHRAMLWLKGATFAARIQSGLGLVPRAGVEPARPYGQRILSP